MKPIYHYNTVSEALAELKEKGFTYDFNLNEKDITTNPHNYEVEHVYRYEGDSSPDDEAVVYGIKSSSDQKGVFVAGFSANSDSDAARVLERLCIEGSGQCKI